VAIVKGFVGFGGGRVVPWGMGVARRITLVGLVKLKKGLESQTPVIVPSILHYFFYIYFTILYLIQ
jgi:hypothetical protein